MTFGCGSSTPGGIEASSTNAEHVRAAANFLTEQAAHAVSDHDGGSAERVLCRERNLEAIVDTGPA